MVDLYLNPMHLFSLKQLNKHSTSELTLCDDIISVNFNNGAVKIVVS